MTAHEDLDRRFKEIVTDIRREMRDPLVEDIFEQVVTAEVALNRNPSEVTGRQKDEILDVLNSTLENTNLLYRPMVITGRVRVAEEMVWAEDEDTRRYMLQEMLGDIGVEQEDFSGSYFSVFDQSYLCGEFEIETKDTVDFNGKPTKAHRIFLNVTPEAASKDAEGWVYAYPEDIASCTLSEASDQKVALELEKRYPELLEQLDVLPADCGNDKKILRALSDFLLTIDWARYRHLSPAERLELLDYCERYMTNRVTFDVSQYQLRARDVYIGIDKSTGEVFIEEVKKPREISGYIGYIRLLEAAAVDNETEERTYLPVLEVLAPAAERGSGNEVVYVPAMSVLGCRNTRNKRLFSRPTERYAPQPQEAEIAVAAPQKIPVIEQHIERSERTRQQELEEIEAKFLKLIDIVENMRNRVFDSIEDAKAAQDSTNQVLREFINTLPEGRTLFEADGPGVLYVPLSVYAENDVDAGTLDVHLSSIKFAESDIFSPQRGYFTGRAQTGIGPAEGDEERFSVDVQLIFVSSEPAGGTIPVFHEEVPDAAVYALSPSQLFIVRPNRDTHITIPELERLRRCSAAIGRVALKLPEHTFLPLYLYELQQEIEGKVEEFIDADAERLRTIGLMVGGDEEGSRIVVDALSEIIGERRALSIVGESYDGEGKLQPSGDIIGMTVGVVTTQPKIPVEEPMFAIELRGGGVRYVPLSTIERLKF